jgi:hypothetical protein
MERIAVGLVGESNPMFLFCCKVKPQPRFYHVHNLVRYFHAFTMEDVTCGRLPVAAMQAYGAIG